jgi:uncharacterized membrane protein (UPF0127 family)
MEPLVSSRIHAFAALLTLSTLLGMLGDCRASRVRAEIAGKVFLLEVAATEVAIRNGLGGRSRIGPRDGMLFVFGESELRGFVMRDCAHPLDLMYLDAAGTVVDVFEMTPEPARGGGRGGG